MSRLGLFGLLACVSACGTIPDRAAGSTANACSVQRVAEMPVRIANGAILIPATINQTKVEMQIDTGASGSMIDQTMAARLALPSDAHRRTTLRGIGGDVESQNTVVRSLEIGGQEWQSLSLSTGHLATEFHHGTQVAGLLGADRLSGFDIELDVPHARMTLWQVSHCAGDFALAGSPHFVVPLAWHTPNRLVARVEIDGHPVEALIDWGSRATTITGAAAASVGVTPAMLAGDRAGKSWGVDRNENIVHLHRFESLRVGRETFHNVGLNVADLHMQEVGMLLGADYASSRRIWLSYATHQMFVVPPALAKQSPP
jgi:predicted aspartyl protease